MVVIFADYIDLIAGSNTELQVLTNRLAETSKAHGIEISHEKSKTIVNSKNNDQNANIYFDGMLLENLKTLISRSDIKSRWVIR